MSGPPDDALARLEQALAYNPYGPEVPLQGEREALATVRDELQRLREERAEIEDSPSYHWYYRAEAALVALADMTHERDVAIEAAMQYRRDGEAALADMRLALEDIERMAGAAGPGETPAAPLASIARRALAAADGTPKDTA